MCIRDSQSSHYGKQKAVRQSTYGVRAGKESRQIVKCKPALAVGEGIINNYKQWCNYKAYEKYFVDQLPYTDEELVDMSKLSMEDLKATAAKLSIEDAASRAGN